VDAMTQQVITGPDESRQFPGSAGSLSAICLRHLELPGLHVDLSIPSTGLPLSGRLPSEKKAAFAQNRDEPTRVLHVSRADT